MAKAVTITKEKLHELLETLQNATASLNQWVREAALATEFPRDIQDFAVKFKVQAADLLAAVEEKVSMLTSQLQKLIAEMKVRETTEDFKKKVRDTIVLVRTSDDLLADVTRTCRASLRSLHSASTSVCSQLQLDDRRRQARDEMQRVIQASLDRAGAVRADVEAAARRAYEVAQEGRMEATRRAHGAAEELRQKTSRRVQAARDAAEKRSEEVRAGAIMAADQLRELSPPAHDKVQQAFLKLQGKGSVWKRAVAAAMEFAVAVVLFFCAAVSAICGKMSSGVAGADVPAPKVKIEGDSALSRLEMFLVDKLEPAGEHISKISVQATQKVGHAYAELHSEKPVSTRLFGASLEMGGAVLLFICSFVSTLCGRVVAHVDPPREMEPVPELNAAPPASPPLSCASPDDAVSSPPAAPPAALPAAPAADPPAASPAAPPATLPALDGPAPIQPNFVEHRVEEVECSDLPVEAEQEVQDTKSPEEEAIERATQVFEDMDRNRDGELSHSEVKRFLREHPDVKKQLGVDTWASFFARWDVDGDGRVQKEEFLKTWLEVTKASAAVSSSSPTAP